MKKPFYKTLWFWIIIAVIILFYLIITQKYLYLYSKRTLIDKYLRLGRMAPWENQTDSEKQRLMNMSKKELIDNIILWVNGDKPTVQSESESVAQNRYINPILMNAQYNNVVPSGARYTKGHVKGVGQTY